MEDNYHDIVSEPIAISSYRRPSVQRVPRARLSAYLSEIGKEDIPWAINFLVKKLTISSATKENEASHVWENYQLSPEIMRLSSFPRVKLPDDYEEELASIIEEKHQ